MYSREKLTIKGRASRRVFPPKNALRTKRPVFYSPGEFTGRRSETHLHKRKVEILRFRAKRELSSNLPPKRKNRPEDRSAENFENGGYNWGDYDIFLNSKKSYFIIFRLKNIIFGSLLCSESNIAKRHFLPLSILHMAPIDTSF